MNLIGLAYSARALGTSAFGLLGFGLSVTAYAAVLTAPGLNVWGVRAVAREPDAAGRYLTIVNSTQFALGVCAYLILAVIAIGALRGHERQIVLVAGIGVFAACTGTQWLAQALQRFELIAVGQVVSAGVSLAAYLVFVRRAEDVFAVPIAILAGQVSGSAMILFALTRAGLSLGRVSPSHVAAALRTSFALGVAPLAISVLHNSNTLILQWSRGAEAVGLFLSGYRLVEVLAVIPTMITSLFFPLLARLSADEHEWEQKMRLFVTLTMSVAFLPGTLMLADPETITSTLYGPDYGSAIPVIRIMGLAVIFNYAAIAYLMAILALHRDRPYLVAIVTTAFMSIIAGMAVVPIVGVMGATLVVSCLDLVTWALTLHTLKRFSRGDLFLAEWRAPAAASAVAGSWLLVASTIALNGPTRMAIAIGLYASVLGLAWMTRSSRGGVRR